MNKSSQVVSQSSNHYYLRKAQATFSPTNSSENEDLGFCVGCRAGGSLNRAIGHTSHPEYRQLALCATCIEHYNHAAIE